MIFDRTCSQRPARPDWVGGVVARLTCATEGRFLCCAARAVAKTLMRPAFKAAQSWKRCPTGVFVSGSKLKREMYSFLILILSRLIGRESTAMSNVTVHRLASMPVLQSSCAFNAPGRDLCRFAWSVAQMERPQALGPEPPETPTPREESL